MRLRRRYVPVAALLGLATAVLPAIASSETAPTVDAVNEGGGVYGERHSWSPTQTTVLAGGVVTFRNSTEVAHGVEWRSAMKPTCEEGAGKVPVGTAAAASATKWSGTCTFSQAGTYTFYCTVHGPEMTGTITVSASGTTTLTTQTTGITPPTTTPTTVTSGPPLVGAPSLRASQHGTTVRGSLDISQAGMGDRLEVDLFASSASLRKAKHVTRVRVGRFVQSSLSAGRHPFAVALDASAKRALKRHRRLALTVKFTLTPLTGESTTVIRSVVEHR